MVGCSHGAPGAPEAPLLVPQHQSAQVGKPAHAAGSSPPPLVFSTLPHHCGSGGCPTKSLLTGSQLNSAMTDLPSVLPRTMVLLDLAIGSMRQVLIR